MVEAPDDVAAVVALGDSISDGVGSELDRNARWPDFLAENLAPHNVAVLNAAIAAVSFCARAWGKRGCPFHARRAAPAKCAVLGLADRHNDIAWPGQPFAPADPLPKIEELIGIPATGTACSHA